MVACTLLAAVLLFWNIEHQVLLVCDQLLVHFVDLSKAQQDGAKTVERLKNLNHTLSLLEQNHVRLARGCWRPDHVSHGLNVKLDGMGAWHQAPRMYVLLVSL